MKRNVLSIITIIAIFFATTSCKNHQTETAAKRQPQTKEQDNKQDTQKTLPQKIKPQSMLMSESPINPANIDNFLFSDDCIYIDLRSAEMFYAEGHIAGFTNIPFYDYIAGFPRNETSLFQMTPGKGSYLGDVGSFSANYDDSEVIIKNMFDAKKNIIAISTAGVESCYFLNLLAQLGYEPERLYNAGSFTNGMGNDIAYRTYKNAKYLVAGMELENTKIEYKWHSLSKK